MTYVRRDESPGIHHVTCRGNNKRSIFEDDRDRRRFLTHVAHVAEAHGWKIHAYCLMRNHYHLVIEIGERGMSRGLCELNTGYALSYNKRHGRVNHLFGKRYWSGGLSDEASFINACRYVVQNPVSAGLVDDPGEWRWSSYRATVGLALAEIPLEPNELRAAFAPPRPTTFARVRKFFSRSTTNRRWQPP
jgi:REP element-mobilizing transposase RayT